MTLMSTTYELATAPGHLPWLSHPWKLVRRPLAFLAAMRELGDIVKLRFGPEWVYLVQHPELLRQLLMDSSSFDKGGPFFERIRILVGDGLGTCPQAVHRLHRRRMQPSFHHDRLIEYAAVMQTEVGTAADAWRRGQVIDVFATIAALSLSILIDAMFVIKAVAGHATEVKRLMPAVSQGLYHQMLVPAEPLRKLLPGNRLFHRSLRGVMAAMDQIIAEYRRAGVEEGDLLATLLAVRDEDTGERMTNREIRDQVLTLILGGTDSITATLAWAFHLIGEHPEAERRLHDEVDDVLAGRPAGFDDVPRLAYTQRIITETLRLYPPAWLFTRRTTTAVELGGHGLAPGTSILLSPYSLQRDPKLFDDPERFDPDRWLPDRARVVPRGAMIPFGTGPRKCIGERFATIETTMILATFAGRIRLRPISGATVQPFPKLVLNPKSLLMRVEPRDRAR